MELPKGEISTRKVLALVAMVRPALPRLSARIQCLLLNNECEGAEVTLLMHILIWALTWMAIQHEDGLANRAGQAA